jgi:hypothetical protein
VAAEHNDGREVAIAKVAPMQQLAFVLVEIAHLVYRLPPSCFGKQFYDAVDDLAELHHFRLRWLSRISLRLSVVCKRVSYRGSVALLPLNQNQKNRARAS